MWAARRDRNHRSVPPRLLVGHARRGRDPPGGHLREALRRGSLEARRTRRGTASYGVTRTARFLRSSASLRSPLSRTRAGRVASATKPSASSTEGAGVLLPTGKIREDRQAAVGTAHERINADKLENFRGSNSRLIPGTRPSRHTDRSISAGLSLPSADHTFGVLIGILPFAEVVVGTFIETRTKSKRQKVECGKTMGRLIMAADGSRPFCPPGRPRNLHASQIITVVCCVTASRLTPFHRSAPRYTGQK